MKRQRDAVDRIIEEWEREWPELDLARRQIFLRLARLQVHTERTYTKALAAHDLTPPEFRVLATLRRSGPPYRLTPSMISRGLFVSTGTMTRQVDNLEEAGLVRRIFDRRDRRSIQVELTAEGRERIDQALITEGQAEEEFLAPLSERERALLIAMLRKLIIALEEPEPEPG